MASAKFNRKTFEKEIAKITPEMENKISMFGTPIENLSDEEIEIDVTPNRPDLLSYQGFKRSFLAFLGRSPGLKKYKVYPPEKDYKVTVDSSVKEVRPYTACAIIKGLKLSDENIKELIDIQEKLHTTVGRKRKKLAIGIYPLEKITLPITFRAVEPDKIKFIPLESSVVMNGLEILQKHPAGKEYAHLLAGKFKFPIFVDAKGEVLSMPPIINSELTGRVLETTKDVFVECSGHDFNSLKKCLNIIVCAMADMGGKIYSMEMVGSPEKHSPNLESEKMKISLENIEKTLGIKVKEKEIKTNLEKMGHGYDKGVVEIAPYRTDVLHEIDLIEDFAIGYGYENFVPEIPSISTIGQEDPRETLKRKISEILSGVGFLETSNYHLTTRKDQFTKMGILEKQESGAIFLETSKTENEILRKDLTSFCLKIFSENVDCEYPQKTFESGRVFFEDDGKLVEEDRLAIAITPGNFTQLKQVLEYLDKMLSLGIESKEEPKNSVHFIEGRVAGIYLGEKKIGEIGVIHPKILKNWKIKMPVTLLEICLEEIYKKLI